MQDFYVVESVFLPRSVRLGVHPHGKTVQLEMFTHRGHLRYVCVYVYMFIYLFILIYLEAIAQQMS